MQSKEFEKFGWANAAVHVDGLAIAKVQWILFTSFASNIQRIAGWDFRKWRYHLKLLYNELWRCGFYHLQDTKWGTFLEPDSDKIACVDWLYSIVDWIPEQRASKQAASTLPQSKNVHTHRHRAPPLPPPSPAWCMKHDVVQTTFQRGSGLTISQQPQKYGRGKFCHELNLQGLLLGTRWRVSFWTATIVPIVQIIQTEKF